jgi:TetR/AcrR family transcriptional repressor of lmrAB and yxaGH operons
MPSNQSLVDSTGTRDRLIGAMLYSLRTKGFHGVGLTEVLDRAHAPKGVLYHHFPGGKTELAVATIRVVVDHITAGLKRLFESHSDPLEGLRVWMADAQKALLDSGYEKGCPLATIALESTANDTAIRDAVAEGFHKIRETLRHALVGKGLTQGEAGPLATLVVSAYEGGLMQSRVAGDTAPLHDTHRILLEIIGERLKSGPRTPHTDEESCRPSTLPRARRR